ncbi:MAG: transposase [Deltaproteobacteria bacterium]|nr:transposase [Deltaproteobacteria bacterium]
MTHKDIKNTIRKQLKKEYPNWKRLSKKEKKAIAKKVLYEVESEYDYELPIRTPFSELSGIEHQVGIENKIMNLTEMEKFISDVDNGNLFRFTDTQGHPAIKDKELRLIDKLLNDQIINRLLSYDGFTPSMREFMPGVFLRAELVKAVKYPEISYRKFCGDNGDYDGHKKDNAFTGKEQKETRAFIGLPLNKNQFISHVQLSQFRNNLTFVQQVNLTVYILHYFNKSGLLKEGVLHCVDSTELAADSARPSATLKVRGKKIRIYTDIDCDCGRRRNKCDKSVYVVGYRMHTLSAICPKTGQSYPLISMLAPANHHDSHFLPYLSKLGKAMGLEINVITADEAYHDKNGLMLAETGVCLVKPPNAKVSIPENVRTAAMEVTLDEFCEIPMNYMGVTADGHEYKCAAVTGECPRSHTCPQFRLIPMDNGRFQPIVHGSEEVAKALELRKNGERPFNLIKKREGLDVTRVRSQQSLLARCTITTMATLLLEIINTRRKRKRKWIQIQSELPLASGF